MGKLHPTVLIVEDEPLVRFYECELAEGAGFLTLTARDAKEALHELEGPVEVQILLTDIKMPGTMDGFALAELVQRRWPGIKILFVSGRFNRGDEEAYPDAVFLSKPFTHRQLTGALLSVV